MSNALNTLNAHTTIFMYYNEDANVNTDNDDKYLAVFLHFTLCFSFAYSHLLSEAQLRRIQQHGNCKKVKDFEKEIYICVQFV